MFGAIIFTICISLIPSPLQHVVIAEETPDLYSPVDDVIRLNSTTFIPTVFHQNKNVTFLVQFYNTFCGHCQMFAPVYKDLASRVKNWTSTIRVAGVDCSKDENLLTCSDNKIEGYPTLLMYPPNARIQDPNDAPLNLRSLNIDWTVDELEETIVDYLTNLTYTNRQFPLVVHSLQPINVTNPHNIDRIYGGLLNDPSKSDNDPNDQQDLMIVVESNTSYLGRKLIIEYYRISNKLELRRATTSNIDLLKSLLQDKDLDELNSTQPLLLRITNKDATSYDETEVATQVLVRGEAAYVLPESAEHEREDFIYNRFKRFFEHFYSIELKESDTSLSFKSNLHGKPDKIPQNDVHVESKERGEFEVQYLLNNDPVASRKIFAIDLLKGIVYMLTHEVKIKGDLDPIEFGTVRNLLTILKKYLPIESWDTSVYKLIVDLRTHLDSNRLIYEQNGIESRKMRDLLDLSGAEAVSLRYNREKWISCSNSDKQQKGYTCSLWLLFHSLTVGEYIKAAPVRVRPTMVLSTMRNYIIKFLGCTVCSSNFEKESESLDSSLTSRNSSVLWLWYTHNHINQRLNNEKHAAKRPLPQVIFPPHHRCPDCFKTNMKEVGMDEKRLEDIEWNSTHVFEFLMDLYRPDRVLSPMEMAKILSRIEGKVSYRLIGISTDNAHGGHGRFRSDSEVNISVEKWNFQSMFSASDISLCLFLYLSCIVMVSIVCLALNPKWRRYKMR